MARYACEYTNLLGIEHEERPVTSVNIGSNSFNESYIGFDSFVGGLSSNIRKTIRFSREDLEQSISRVTGHQDIRFLGMSDDRGHGTVISLYVTGILNGSQHSTSIFNNTLFFEPQGLHFLTPGRPFQIHFRYSHEVEGISTESSIAVEGEGFNPQNLREIVDVARASGLVFNKIPNQDSEETQHFDNPSASSIRCVNLDTLEETTITVASPIGNDVTVTIVDGDPPMTSLANGNSSIFIDDAGAVRMQAATPEGAPLASFFLTEHGAGGFNVNGSFFANGNREASFGGGGHTFTLDSRGYTFRHNREEVTFTFEDMQRLKELIG